MDSKIAKQFIRATSTVFGEISDLSLTNTELEFFAEGYRSPADISVYFTVSGAFSGQLIITLDNPMALKLASASLMGVPVNNFDKIAESAVCELGNMIGGSAGKRLLEIGFDCDISYPTLKHGKEVDTSAPTFVARFECEWGKLQQILKFACSSQIK
ncbi:MAG: chemotaxis protein CheX [Candidatus Rifleibacteriota bacterium]